MGKILVLGGYGANNVGDDAQLAGALSDIASTMPDAGVTVLTPNAKQTKLIHKLDHVSAAPRVSFFDLDVDAKLYVRYEIPANREFMLSRVEHIYENALRYSVGLSHALTDKQLSAVQELESSSLVYYAGGGYLMGPTASRLWDGMLYCRLAGIFDVPVVMSGQNVGVWETDYDKTSAKAGFRFVDLLGTRDGTFSAAELELIGIAGSHIMTTHDDALYIEPAEAKVCDYIVRSCGLNIADYPYLTLSFHQAQGIRQVVETTQRLSRLPILIVPTCPADLGPQEQVFNELIEAGFKSVYRIDKVHHFSKVRGIIGRAYATISSRHHPLIFAMGANVPCISLNYSEYFDQKNFGAMTLCGIGDFSVDVRSRTDVDPTHEYEAKLTRLLSERQELSEKIAFSHNKIRASKSRFLAKAADIWARASQ